LQKQSRKSSESAEQLGLNLFDEAELENLHAVIEQTKWDERNE
jgi:hypothetical protein